MFFPFDNVIISMICEESETRICHFCVALLKKVLCSMRRSMKAIIIYYSLNGNTQYVAEKISSQTGADVLRLIPDKEPPKTGPGKFFFGGKAAMFGEKVRLQDINVSFEHYDTVIIGAPVWAGTYPPAIATFLQGNSFKKKALFVFSCSSSGNGKPMIDKIVKNTSGNRLVATESLLDPLTHKEEDKKIDHFCQLIIEK